MHSSRNLLPLAALAALASAPALHAQLVSAGLSGAVTDSAGRPIAGARVAAVHVPTGTTYSAVAREDGSFVFRSLIVGGPFTLTVTAEGYRTTELTDVVTQLGKDVEVSLSLPASDVVQLEKFVVTGEANELDAGRVGAGSVLGSDRLGAKPTTQRSLADLVSASPFVTLRSMSGDREEAQITALGQNNRYNSIQIDGSRINDQFGLNGTGLASFYNPLSLETVEQLAVQVSPYDVRQSGFTGASINAVTKSGTNQFKGSAYYIFSGDHVAGLQMQGEDVQLRSTSGVKSVPKLERTTYGFTLGGPIIRNRLFFFTNYEKFERIAAPSTSGLTNVDSTQLKSILDKFAAYNTAASKSINWGGIGGNAANESYDKKFLAKVDWNISSNHRASVRYSRTNGLVPQFGSFTSTSRTITSTSPTLSSSGVTALDSHFYSQERTERNLSAQVFSQWTTDFKTELRYSQVNQDQLTPVNAVSPEVTIYGITGVNRNGSTISSGALVAGTEQFRQGNEIKVKTRQYSATGDYVLGNVVLSGGYEREWNDFYNLFRQSSYGLVTFASVSDFLADRAARIERSYYDPTLRPAGDLSDFATNGFFGQAKWTVNSRLDVTAGIRYEVSETKKKPKFNAALLQTTGFDNTGTLDGVETYSPRVGFNLSLDNSRKTQLRGGAGHFLGRAPWVFFSNSYNNIGVGSYTVATNNPAVGSFGTYLSTFDVANPIATGSDTSGARREVNWTDPGVKLPSTWRGNIAIDHRMDFLKSQVSAEFVYSQIDQALFISNENLRATTVGADGRQRFAGTPSTAANAKYSAYTDLYRIRNVSEGESTYLTFSWSRPVIDKWGFDASYTRGRSTEAQAIGQTTASGQWQRNVVFNQSAVEVGTSDFEVRNRYQLSVTREFEFLKKQKTQVSLYYEHRTGNPFSWIYANDLNGDGQSNDAAAVPTGVNDGRFNFSAMTTAQIDTFLKYYTANGLDKYAGSYAPKNAFVQPSVNRLDLRLSHTVPVWRSVKTEFFMDFTNFGSFLSKKWFNYYEEARQTNDVFRRQFIGTAQYDANGKIQPALFTASWTNNTTGATSTTTIYDNNAPVRSGFTLTRLVPVSGPDTFTFDNGMSRWRIQVGVKLTF